MAYKQIKEILGSVRQFHHHLRQDVEQKYSDMDDDRSKFLLRSIRRGEQEMGVALARYEKDGEAPVLETWIQYVPLEEVQTVLQSDQLPSYSSPNQVLAWKQEFDASLAEFYRQLADQVSAPRAKELFESLATVIEQRLRDQTWQAREEELAPREDN